MRACVRVYVFLGGVSVCVFRQNILSNNKIAFQIAPKKQIWENIIMLFGSSGADGATPSAVSELKIRIPTQQYKACPSAMDSSPRFFYIYQGLLALVLSKTKLA